MQLIIEGDRDLSITQAFYIGEDTDKIRTQHPRTQHI